MARMRVSSQPTGPSGALAGWLGWRPLLVCSLATVAGVALADRLPHGPVTAVVWVASAVVFLAGTWTLRGWLSDALLLLSAFAAGAAWYTVRLCPEASHISRLAPARPAVIVARVVRSSHGEGATICRAEKVLLRQGHPPIAVSGLFELQSRLADELRAGQLVTLYSPALRPWRPRTNPAQHRRGDYWERRRVWCYARTSKVTVVNAPVRPCIADLAADWRQQLNQRLMLAMPGKNPDLYARLLGAIVYGASLEDLPEDIVELYRRTGTIHVLVVSGSQVSLLVVVLLTLSRGRRRSVRAHHLILVVPAAFLYATLCGREPSIMRAAALAFVLVSGLHAARPYDLPTALAFVGVILVLAEPADLFTPGLQLTFAACVGVAMAVRLLPAPREKCAFPARLAYGIAAILCGTLGAWVMTTPILAYDFGAVAITGNLANALVVPLSSIALIFGLPGTFLALANPMLATGPLWFCRYALAISVAINAWCARLPAAFAEALHPTPIMVAAWYLAVGAAYLLARHGGRTGKIYAVIAGPAALVALLLLMAAPPHRTCVTVTWLDVGEGLATVIETPDGHFALFDAGSRDPDLRGPRAARQVLLPYLRSRGCRRISAVVLSHADVDHFNAVSMLAERLRIDRVIVSPNGSGKEYEQLLTELAGAGTEVVAARVGASVHLGRAAFLHFLHPQPYVVGGGSDNDNCLVAMLESGKHRVLMTGDIEAEGQWELLRAVGQTHLRADVLQVPHHARKSAFLGTFLDAVKPELAVAPTGPAYLGGEPDPRFADYFAARGAAFAETASSGAVTAILSPAGIVWRPFLSSPPSQFFASPHNRQVQ